MELMLLITGSMGAGKTATLGEASDLLAARGIAHAAVDLDALALAYGPLPLATVGLRNLAAVCDNYETAGIRKLLAAGAIESREELEQIRRATNASSLFVCRLRAPIEVMERRVAGREKGIFAQRYVARVRVLDAQLDKAALEQLEIDTTDATVTDVARQMLAAAGWIADGE
jgi:adenylylsulfate kinase